MYIREKREGLGFTYSKVAANLRFSSFGSLIYSPLENPVHKVKSTWQHNFMKAPRVKRRITKPWHVPARALQHVLLSRPSSSSRAAGFSHFPLQVGSGRSGLAPVQETCWSSGELRRVSSCPSLPSIRVCIIRCVSWCPVPCPSFGQLLKKESLYSLKYQQQRLWWILPLHFHSELCSVIGRCRMNTTLPIKTLWFISLITKLKMVFYYSNKGLVQHEVHFYTTLWTLSLKTL